MTISEKITAEMLAWNDKLAGGYQLSDIERAYVEGLRKSYLAMLKR